MHIKLINPRMNCRPSDARLKFRLLPPQSLLLLGGLTPDRHEVVIVDENVERDARVDDSPDLVGIPVFVATAKRAYQLADAYRRRGVPVVLGGLHASLCPEEAKDHADSVVVGEADETWPRLLQDLEAGRLQPFYRNQEAAPLLHAPFLRRDLVASRRYASVAAMRTGRGCPNRCAYCYQSAFYPTRGLRHQAIDRVVAEVRGMKSRHVLFLDDNIVGDRNYCRALFEALTPLGITWSGAATISVADDPTTLRLARQSGCRSLFIGLESLNQGSLDEHGKRRNRVDRYAEQIDAIHQQGIMVNGSFMFGFDQDRPDVFERAISFIVAQRIETATFHILTPYPGTELYASLDAQGRIIDRDWDHYNTAHAVFRPAHMTPEELEEGTRWAYRSAYSWSNVLGRAPKVPCLKLPYWGFVLGYKKLGAVTNVLSRLGLMESLFSLFARVLMERGAGTSIYSDAAVSPGLEQAPVPPIREVALRGAAEVSERV